MSVVLTMWLVAAGVQAGGAVSGTVRDAHGGVLPGARVSVVSQAAPVRTTTTDAKGTYVISGLPSGPYELMVALSGFKSSRNRLQLAVGEAATADIRLELGSLSEVIVVSGAAAGTPRGVWPSTPSDYLDAAKIYYEQGRLADAEAMTQRALELLRAAVPTVPPAAAAPRDLNAPVRVGGSIREPRKIQHVAPAYPAEALAAGAVGTVIIEAIISKDGTIRNARVLRGVPLLDQAALVAVQQWMFTPTLLNGVPLEVTMTVSVTFTR